MDHLPVMFIGLQAGRTQNWVLLIPIEDSKLSIVTFHWRQYWVLLLSIVCLLILVQTLCRILVWKISCSRLWHEMLPLVPQIFMLYSEVPCISHISKRACNFFRINYTNEQWRLQEIFSGCSTFITKLEYNITKKKFA